MIHLRALVLGAKLGADTAYAWSDLIPFVFSIVNNNPKLPLAISPLSMVDGIFANYDQLLLSPHAPEGHSNPVDYVEGLVKWQNRLLELAKGIQSKYLERILLTHAAKNENTAPRAFNEGDFVLQIKTLLELEENCSHDGWAQNSLYLDEIMNRPIRFLNFSIWSVRRQPKPLLTTVESSTQDGSMNLPCCKT